MREDPPVVTFEVNGVSIGDGHGLREVAYLDIYTKHCGCVQVVGKHSDSLDLATDEHVTVVIRLEIEHQTGSMQ